MAYQSREYFCNGKSVLLDKYQDVEDAKNDQEIEYVNSMGSGVYQSNAGDNFNQTGNQFMDSTRFNKVKDLRALPKIMRVKKVTLILMVHQIQRNILFKISII